MSQRSSSGRKPGVRIAGQYGKADQLYRSSIDAIAAALGPTHVLLAGANYGLALNEIAQGRAESADELVAQATAILGQQDDRVLRDNLLDCIDGRLSHLSCWLRVLPRSHLGPGGRAPLARTTR